MPRVTGMRTPVSIVNVTRHFLVVGVLIPDEDDRGQFSIPYSILAICQGLQLLSAQLRE